MSLLDYCRTESEKRYAETYEGEGEGSYRKTAKILGAGETSVRTALNLVKARASADNYTSEVYKPLRYTQPLPKPLLIPAAKPVIEYPKSPLETILVIPDWHQCPNHPHRLEAIKWIARFGSERRIPRVVHLGDWGTFDSVSRHAKNETYEARSKPTIQQDIDHLQLSLKTWLEAKDADWKPKQEFNEGNHEYRANYFENANPELHGFIHTRIEELFTQYGWRFHKFAEPFYIQGVAFVHHVNNLMGKAIGGKTGAQRIGNETTSSFVYGHSHHWKFVSTAKTGLQSGVDVLETGCALPWGEVEHYASHSMNDWWWGVTVIKVCEGRIIDVERVSMLTLEAKYKEPNIDFDLTGKLRAA